MTRLSVWPRGTANPNTPVTVRLARRT